MIRKLLITALLLGLAVNSWAFGRREKTEDAKPTDISEIMLPQKPPHKKSLLELTEAGDVSGVEQFLNIDIDLNKTDDSGRTALHAATETGNETIAAILLARGADPNAPDDSGRRPLLEAVERENENLIRMLVAAGADITLPDDKGATPVSLAMDTRTVILSAMLTKANVDAARTGGIPLLHYAAGTGRTGHLEALIKAGADINLQSSRGQRAIDAALEDGPEEPHIKCAEILVRNGSLPPQDPQWDYLAPTLADTKNEITFSYGATPLHLAAERGQEGMVLFLLDRGYRPQVVDKPGNTPLHVAVRKGYRSIAGILLDNGALIDTRDFNGNTPLHESLTTNDGLKMTTLLLERGADANSKNASGLSPLHLCVLMGADPDAARLLINNGAVTDSRDRNGNTPLMLAVETAERPLAELFVDEKANIFARNNKGKTPVESILGRGAKISGEFFTGSRASKTDNEGRSVLHLATEIHSDANTIQALLDNGAPIDMRDAYGDTPLHYAVTLDYRDTAILLLNNGADLSIDNNKGESPLIQAFRAGAPATLEILEGRLDIPDSRGRTPLYMAASWTYPDIVQALLENGANPRQINTDGETPLHAAVQSGSAETVSMLLEAGSPLDTPDNNGLTPLHNAVQWENPALADMLLKQGADKNAPDKHGQSALHLAVESTDPALLCLLIDSGALLDNPDSKGRTPLLLASANGNTEAVAMLLKAGANLSWRDDMGRTALHTALAAGQGEAANLLLESGSDFFALDAQGKTPMELALNRGTAFLDAFITPNLTRLQDNRGNSLLHIAVDNRFAPDVIRLLLEKGADRQLRNARGKTAGNLAQESGQIEIAALLL